MKTLALVVLLAVPVSAQQLPIESTDVENRCVPEPERPHWNAATLVSWQSAASSVVGLSGKAVMVPSGEEPLRWFLLFRNFVPQPDDAPIAVETYTDVLSAAMRVFALGPERNARLISVDASTVLVYYRR